MSKEIVKANSDFLFIYEGKNTNPNGDPDMENKPRMDYETKTNLVTDLRVKRNIREYLKDSGKKIFVDTLADRKVSADTMLNHIVEEVTGTQESLDKIFSGNEMLKGLWNTLTEHLDGDKKSYSGLREIAKSKPKKDDTAHMNIKEHFPKFNNSLLQEIIKQSLTDIRMFGGAFAVEGFSRTYTGPIQLNWGYSLHPVELIKSNTIVPTMSSSEKDASTMGKDYRLYYSLIAFHGTINKHLAVKTGLTEEDVHLFRKAIINSVAYKPTRSKGNQYPMLYVELEYEDRHNGYLRDLRDFIACSVKDKNEPVRSADSLNIDFSGLETLINQNKNIIKQIHLWKTPLPNTGFGGFGTKLDSGLNGKIKELIFTSGGE
jgi:CRISPR-associated protein Csh2